MSEPPRIYVRWSDDGQRIRRWSREPFELGEPFVATDAAPIAVDLTRIHHDALLAELQRRLTAPQPSVAACLTCGARAGIRCVDDRCCAKDERDTAFDWLAR